MATRTRIGSSNTENLLKDNLNKAVKQKMNAALARIPGTRTALGDRTNKESKNEVPNLKKHLVKPEEKKHVTVTSQFAKPKVLQKSHPVLLKPTVKDGSKKVLSDKENHTQLSEKPVNELIANFKLPYSVEHFGLEDEKDVDPQLVPHYINDIMAYLRTLESKYIVNEMFLISSKTSPRMRCVLVNWLVEVHINFKLSPETLFLCISIIDRYLEKNKTIGRDSLQLVGITALWTAAKYEEIYGPDIDDLVYICDNLFTKKDVVKMEQSIIKALNFNFANPCALHFLRRYSKVCKVEHLNHILAKYLIELTLVENKYSAIKPSLIAASALYLSIKLLDLPAVGEKSLNTITVVSGYKTKDLLPVVASLASSVLSVPDSKYQAIKTKYQANSYNKISSREELKSPLIKKYASKATK